MPRFVLLLALVLAACGASGAQPAAPTPDVAATQTRATEVAQIAELAATVRALASTPTPAPTQLPPTAQATRVPTAAAARPPLPPSPAGTPGGASARATPRPTATARGVPAFSDLVFDEARGRLYGPDPLGGKLLALALPDLRVVGTVDLGQASRPAAVDLSPDGAELAVALAGAGNIALVDPERLVVTGKLYPTVQSGPNVPWDVRYARPGRLYSVGNPGSAGTDYIHLFDTAERIEVGISKYPETADGSPRLALAEDGTLFVCQSSYSPQQLFRFTLDGDTPKRVAQGPHGPVSAPDLAVRPDGSAVYTAGGQVWSGNLQSQLGAFTARGTRIEYVPATERLFVCLEAAVAEVQAHDPYNVVATHPVSATPRVARANAAGTVLYVSTDAGLDVIRLDQPTRGPRL